MAGLTFRENKYGLTTLVGESWVIENSQTLTIGDVVDLVNDAVALVGAGNEMYGVVLGFLAENGRPLENSVSGEDYDGTYTAGNVGTGTYVATSDNVTDKKVKALVRPFAPGDKYSVVANATLGTTGNSENAGGYFNLTAGSDTLDESTFSAGTTAQFFSYGQDPKLEGLYVIVEPYELQTGSSASA